MESTVSICARPGCGKTIRQRGSRSGRMKTYHDTACRQAYYREKTKAMKNGLDQVNNPKPPAESYDLHSYNLGKFAGLELAADLIMDKAIEYFKKRLTTTADELRQLADEIRSTRVEVQSAVRTVTREK